MKFNLNEVFQPKLFGLFKKGQYSKSAFASDLMAGLIVGIIALPLAIAFATASGVPPQNGLITAIIAGFLISFCGGSDFLIGGPTGAFIVIITGIISGYGFQGLLIATIMAGIFLVLMGVFKMGAIFKYIPYPIVVGFTSGIALTIFSTQMNNFFGLGLGEMPEEFYSGVPSEFIRKWIFYFSEGTVNIWETLLSLACLVICFTWKKVTKKIPGSLIALIFAVVVSLLVGHYTDYQFATIGSGTSSSGSAWTLNLSEFEFSKLPDLLSPAFTIAILCAVESLLAAMVADGATGKKHHANTELIGQGVANIVTPLFGGIPATGALARTMASINNGGKSPVTGLVHAIVLLLIFLFLMPYVSYVPMACLAAILVQVAYNMSEWKTFKYLLRGDRSDVAVLLITFFLTVIFDLTIAIEVGVLLAIVLFVRRVMQTTHVNVVSGDSVAATEDSEKASMEDTDRLAIPKGVEVYEIDGPFFFGLASRFEELESAKGGNVKVRIIRMRKVPFIDSTGVNNLRNLCERTSKRGVTVILSGVTDKVYETLKKFGVDEEIGNENIFPHIVPALERANELVK
ncbi:MAG: STAS domain-containing protein [Bacteroidales bacterium]|nr:STAS domain-containing protein [Bacteroidales bacterium]